MKKLLPALAVLAFTAGLLLRPEAVSAAIREGLVLCYQTVIPSLFPFFAAVGLLIRLGLARWLQGLCRPFMAPMFRLRGVCAMPLLAGLLGGYPSGAQTAAELWRQGQLSRREAELLLGFANNCGPAFLLSFIGAGVLGSARAGAWLLLVHVAAALTTGIVLCHLVPGREPPPAGAAADVETEPLPRAITASVSAALTSTLGICAYVTLFRAVMALLPGDLPAWAIGVFELVSGAAALTPGPTGFVAAAAVAAWGGLSVHCQTMAVTEGLSLRWHWIGKIMQTGISVLFAAGVSRFVF